MSKIVHCSDGVYWDAGEEPRENAESGVCRRLAPTARLDTPAGDYQDGSAAAIWPATSPEHGCGEGKAK